MRACACLCLFFLWKRLKQKSQSVDIASQGFSALIPGLHSNRASPPVAKATTFEVQENNATNSQRCAPRSAELKRGYTIGTQACLDVSWCFLACCMCLCVCVYMYVCMYVCIYVAFHFWSTMSFGIYYTSVFNLQQITHMLLVMGIFSCLSCIHSSTQSLLFI